MFIGLSGFVLLIACSNLAHLLLARTMARAREFALCAALGASRSQLLRPLLLESLLLSIAGGIGAIFIALWTNHWLAIRSTDDQGSPASFALDWTVMMWAGIASLVTAFAFGIVPALFAMRIDLNRTLKSGSRGTTGNRGHQRLRNLLIIGQFALALVLLTGTTLFTRGLNDLNNRREGWESDHMISGTFLLPQSNDADDAPITAFQRLALERLQTLPGVDSVSISHRLPYLAEHNPQPFIVDGHELPEPGQDV